MKPRLGGLSCLYGIESHRASVATVRVSRLPNDVTRDDLPRFLSLCGDDHPLGPPQHMQIHSLATRAGLKQLTKTATMTFKKVPALLLAKETEWSIPFVHHNKHGNIVVDTHFDSFTVLNEPENHVLEYVNHMF